MSQNPFGHQRATCSSKLKQNAHNVNQAQAKLPDKIDTKKVVDMIKNADLYELINISLRSNELQNETVEDFISKALLKGGNQTYKHKRVNELQRQDLLSLFTPPNKSQQRQGASTSPINQRSINDENLQFISDFIAQSVNSQKQQINNHINQRSENQIFKNQGPLQPSILENSPDQNQCISIFNHGQKQIHQHLQNYQSFNSKQQDQQDDEQEEQIMGFGNELDDTQDFENHEQRLDVPQPYSDQPRSPAEENTEQSTQVKSHLRNPSFSGETNFIKSSVQQSNFQDSVSYHGDQFSFQLKQNSSSFIKKSPDASNYSTINQDRDRSPSLEGIKSQINSNSQKSIEKSTNCNKCCKKETSLTLEEPKIQIGRNLNNFRQGVQTQMNRSSSSNSFLTQKDNLNISGLQSSRNHQQVGSTKHQFQPKTYLQTSRTQIQEPQICKTPEASQSFMDQCSFLNSNIKQEDFDQSMGTSGSKENMQQTQVTNIVAKKNIEVKKQRLLNSFAQMNIKFLIELERIKKPSQVAYITARLVCQFFSIFRELSSQHSKGFHMEDLIEWSEIQKHINGHVIKYTNELLTSIKNKMLNPDQMSQQLKEVLEIKLFELKQDFFHGDNLKLFKHLSTNKNLQTIVTFIFNVISYYLDLQFNQKIVTQSDNQSVQESQRKSSSSRQMEDTQSFKINKGNQNSLINQSTTQISSQRSNEKSQNRRKSRNLIIGKIETTPTLQRDKTPRVQAEEKQHVLQKSGSRCLLQRRDKSQLVQKDPYQSNKSPLIKAKHETALIKSNRQEQQQELSQQSLRKHNFDWTIQRKPVTQSRQKSLSKSPSQVITKAESKPQSMQQESRHESTVYSEFSTPSCYFPINFQSKDSQIEEPLHLNYKMMAESTILQQIIKEKTAAIEENMKISSQIQNESDYQQDNGQKKHIDMNLIEQIKQRRKDQIIKEAKEERLQQSASRRRSMEINTQIE